MQSYFFLTSEARKPIQAASAFARVRIPLNGHTPPKHIKKRVVVAEGTLLATHPNPVIGDMHASITGTIKELSDSAVELEALAEGTTTEVAFPEPLDLNALAGQELLKALKELGITTRPFTRPCTTFVINGLNPEPGMAYAEEMLLTCQHVLEAGLALVKRISSATEFILAVPNGNTTPLDGATSQYVPPVYPNSLARPLCTLLFGKESTANITVVRLHALYTLGLVAQSGLPLTRTIATVQGENFLLPIGAPVADLLRRSNHTPEEGDTIILGGAMRGKALANESRGMGKDDEAMALIKKGTVPPLEDNPCIGCGACVSICPMGLMPNLLSRYAEFEQYAACREADIEICIECGLCAYVCPACRPMQQHYRMAKYSLGLSTHQESMPLRTK